MCAALALSPALCQGPATGGRRLPGLAPSADGSQEPKVAAQELARAEARPGDPGQTPPPRPRTVEDSPRGCSVVLRSLDAGVRILLGSSPSFAVFDGEALGDVMACASLLAGGSRVTGVTTVSIRSHWKTRSAPSFRCFPRHQTMILMLCFGLFCSDPFLYGCPHISNRILHQRSRRPTV